LTEFLSKNPGTISVRSIANDEVSYQFASDLYDVLKASGWKMKDDQVFSFIIGGKPWTGVMIEAHGNPVKEGEQITIPNTDPIASLGYSLRWLEVSKLTFQRDSNQEEGLIILFIGSHP
jgi:hypothetical protein